MFVVNLPATGELVELALLVGTRLTTRAYSAEGASGHMNARPAHARTKNRDEFRDVIVQTARRLYLTNGISQTSMADLGKALGVSKPTVYEVFPSKQMLIDAVFKSAVDDVDYGWILRAADEKPALPVFLDQTAHGYKQLVSSARSVEAFSLLIREGGHSEELTAAFARYLSVPASTAARSYIAHLISSGQCVPLNVEVIQKMMTAPLFHAMLDRTLLRENSMSPALVEAYIDGSMSALKALLCTDNGATPLASRLRFREIS